MTSDQDPSPPALTPEAIAQIAAQAAVAAVQHMKADPELKLYTSEEAAALIGKTAWWLEDQARACTVPFTRVGRTVMFSADHIRAIHAQGEVDPATRRPKGRPVRRRRPAAA